VCQAQVDGATIYLGLFNTEREASERYVKHAQSITQLGNYDETEQVDIAASHAAEGAVGAEDADALGSRGEDNNGDEEKPTQDVAQCAPALPPAHGSSPLNGVSFSRAIQRWRAQVLQSVYVCVHSLCCVLCNAVYSIHYFVRPGS